MARPRRTADEGFYDVFTSMPVAEQIICLRILNELHRQGLKSDTARKAAKVLGKVLDEPNLPEQDRT